MTGANRRLGPIDETGNCLKAAAIRPDGALWSGRATPAVPPCWLAVA